MDRDWEEYYDELEEYKAVTGIDPEKKQEGGNETHSSDTATSASSNTSEEDLSAFFTGGHNGNRSRNDEA